MRTAWILVGLLLTTGWTVAQQPSATVSASKPKAAGKPMPAVTPEREAAAMTFVKQHHPELAELLVHLKENSSRDYDRAVRELFRTSERLALVQERGDPATYDLELKVWKARSRAQLVAARLKMSDSEELRKQLRSTLAEEHDARLELLARDRDKASDRAKHLQEQIDKLHDRRDEAIENQFKQMTKTARPAVKVKTTVKPKVAK